MTVRENPNLWEQVCRSQGLKVEEVIKSQEGDIVPQLTTEYIPSPVNESVRR